MRLLSLVFAGLLLAATAFGYSGSGGVWAQKSGDFVSKNFAGTVAGIQAAISYAGTGGNVTVWPGQYLVSTPITITTSGLTFAGSGDSTVFVNSGSTGDDIFQVSGDRVTFYNFKIDGLNGTRTAGRGIETSGDYTTVEKVHFINTPDAAIASGATAGAANAYLKVVDCVIENPGDGGSTDGFGVLLSDSDDAEIVGNQFSSSSHAAVYVFNDSQRALVANNKVVSGDDNGIRTSQDSEKARIIGNLVAGCTVDGIRADADSSLVVGNVSVDNTQAGIKTDGTNGGLWESNVCTGNDVNGLHINNATTDTKGLVIKGNYSCSNVGAGLNVNPRSADVVNLLVEGNQFLNNTFEGIRTAAGTSGSSLIYINNYSSGNLTADAPNLSATNWTYTGFYPSGTTAHEWLTTGGKSGVLYIRAAGDTLRWGTQGSDAVAVVGQGLTGTDAGKLYSRSGNSGTTTPRIGLQRGSQIDFHLGADGTAEYIQFRNALIFGLVTGGAIAKITTAGKLRLGDTTTPTHGLEVTTDAQVADSVRVGSLLKLGLTTFAALGTPDNRTIIYCTDCTKATPCGSGGSGALAKRINGAWDCD